MVALQDPSTTINLLLVIASSLFIVETAAFLGVATFFRPASNGDYDNVEAGLAGPNDGFS